MSIKTFKPTTPSRRQMTVSGFDGIDKKAKPEPSLTEPLKKSSGRNSYGRITVRHRGGGNKRKYRIIDFKRDKIGSATVLRLEYDPNRSANIALIQYEDGEKRYILAPLGLKAGHKIMTGPEADILPGNALPIANIPVGTVIHNIELHPVCLPARSASCAPTATPPSVRLATSSTRTSTSARPAASVTWAGVPPCAAPS